MLTVYKYDLPMDDIVTIEMPAFAKVLHVAEQHGKPRIWALVNPQVKPLPMKFRIAGTGHPIQEEDAEKFVGTFFMHNGGLVFHVFEINR